MTQKEDKKSNQTNCKKICPCYTKEDMCAINNHLARSQKINN